MLTKNKEQTVQRLRPLYPLWILEGAGQQTDKQTENSKPEATLIPVDSWGERANKHTENSITEATHIPCGSSGGAGQYS